MPKAMIYINWEGPCYDGSDLRNDTVKVANFFLKQAKSGNLVGVVLSQEDDCGAIFFANSKENVLEGSDLEGEELEEEIQGHLRYAS